jgi:hypothetical protein
MAGPEMRAALHQLANRFAEVAVPHAGPFARRPARPETRFENGGAPTADEVLFEHHQLMVSSDVRPILRGHCAPSPPKRMAA